MVGNYSKSNYCFTIILIDNIVLGNKKIFGTTYIGELDSNGNAYGKGKFPFCSFQYIGTFMNNQKHGFGIEWDRFKEKFFIGEFKNDKKNGKMTIYKNRNV